ncbi:MAG: hypothetical protein DMF50_01690 [Acidobacteria bacterium]|nr:MAG: hypothetical protein DMF50_01690 [Acidobacteriota bacterium]
MRRPAWPAAFVVVLFLCACYTTHHYSELEEGLDAGSTTAFAASLQVVACDLAVHRAAPGRLYDLDLTYCRTHFAPRVIKAMEGSTAVLRIGLRRRERGEAAPAGDERNALDVGLAPDHPLDLSLDLGAGRHTADLGGLMLSRLALATGAGTARVAFDDPLAGDLAAFTVSGGPGRLTIARLGNASPATFALLAGDGDFEIDLRGAWHGEAGIQVSVSLGDVTLLVPRTLGVQMSVRDGGPAELVLPEFTRDEQGTYRSPSYPDARHHVAIEIGPGLGRVEARWVEET